MYREEFGVCRVFLTSLMLGCMLAAIMMVTCVHARGVQLAREAAVHTVADEFDFMDDNLLLADLLPDEIITCSY